MGRIIGLFLAICIFFVNTAGAATKEKEAENAYLREIVKERENILKKKK